MFTKSGRIHIDDLILEKVPKILLDATDNLNFEDKLDPGPFVDLRAKLAGRYSDAASAKRIAEDANIKTSHIDFNTSAINFWNSILKEAEYTQKVGHLEAAVLTERGDDKEIREAFRKYKDRPP